MATSDYLSTIIPGYDKNAGAASDVITQLLSGTPSISTTRNAAAAFGADNGLGVGSGVTNRFGYDLYSEQGNKSKQQGIQDLLALINGISSPELTNQGQQFQLGENALNYGQRQNEFNVDQSNNARDFAENQRRFNYNNPVRNKNPDEVGTTVKTGYHFPFVF